MPRPALAADDPGQLTAEAMAASPDLEALRSRAAALQELAGAAGAWQDPTFSFEYSNAPIDSFDLNENPRSGLEFRAQQLFPPRGWSRSKERVAQGRTRVATYELVSGRNRLRREVFLSFHRLTLSRMLETVTREHLARVDELLHAVEARYETGGTGQHPVLRLELLRDRLHDDLLDFRRTDQALGAALERVVARPAPDGFSTPAELQALRPPVEPLDEWIARGRARRPELARLEALARTALDSVELARIEAKPDVRAWIGYRVRTLDTPIDSGTDQVSVGIAVPLPMGSASRARAEQAAQRFAARGARAEWTAELDRMRAELTAIEARWKRSYRQAMDHMRSRIPAARLALESALSDYAVGRGDFSTLYESQVDLLELQRSLQRSIVDTHVQAAERRYWMGTVAEDDREAAADEGVER